MDIIGIVTSSFETTRISPLEAIMLICWGMSWPVSVFKTLRTKKVNGKSPIFISLIAVGYVSAILHKVLYSYDYLVLLYLFNLSMILTDLYLYTKYNLRDTGDSKHIKRRESTTNKISVAPNVS